MENLRLRADGKIALVDVMKKHYSGLAWRIDYTDGDKLNGQETLVWQDKNVPSPTQETIKSLVQQEQILFEKTRYQYFRAPEYPSIGDQLDALWKGGDAAAEMLVKVQAVKEKYPKP
jgi:hypothetical protein